MGLGNDEGDPKLPNLVVRGPHDATAREVAPFPDNGVADTLLLEAFSRGTGVRTGNVPCVVLAAPVPPRTSLQ